MRDPVAQERAQALRRDATDAERHLWRHLRRRQLHGYRFRRQVPIAGYIADFACLEGKIVIEVDGGQHADQGEYDRHRDTRIQAQGYRVLRFWDNQVLLETSAVLEVIAAALASRHPHPDLPPQAGEGTES